VMMILATGKNEPLRPSTQKGFTLIEIMISIAILSVGLILILQGLTHCLSILNISRNNLETSLLAENKMAELEIAIKQDPAALSRYTSGQLQTGNIEFRWQINLTPDSEYEDLRQAQTTVYWKEGIRKGLSTFNTYLVIPHDKYR